MVGSLAVGSESIKAAALTSGSVLALKSCPCVRGRLRSLKKSHTGQGNTSCHITGTSVPMAEVNDSLEGSLGSRMSGDDETVFLTTTMQMSGCECKQRPGRGQPGQTDTVVRDLNMGAGARWEE